MESIMKFPFFHSSITTSLAVCSLSMSMKTMLKIVQDGICQKSILGSVKPAPVPRSFPSLFPAFLTDGAGARQENILSNKPAASTAGAGRLAVEYGLGLLVDWSGT